MYWMFIIISLLLLGFNLEWVLGRPYDNRYVLIWQWNQFRLIRIMPKNSFILVDGDKVYKYFRRNNRKTYIPAIQMDNGMKVDILHHKYLLDWVINPPVLRKYPPHLKTDMEILNFVRI